MYNSNIPDNNFNVNEEYSNQFSYECPKAKEADEIAVRFCTLYRTVYRGVVYIYTNKCYKELVEPALALNKFWRTKWRSVTTTTLNLALENIKTIAGLDSDRYPELPCWKNQAERIAKNYIPFQNGILNIEKLCENELELLPHTPDFISMYCLPYDYDPSAICTRWLKFLNQVFENDLDTILLLQEICGYLLTADNSRQVFFLLYGKPRAGKGVIASIMRALIGEENACGFNLSRLLDRFSLASLRRKQLVVVGEVELSQHEVKRIFETLKSIIGLDPQTFERKGQDVKETGILPCKWVICSNALPNFHDNSGAMAARMKVVKFNKTFAGSEDVSLTDNLKEELSGIALWAIEGLKRLQKQGWTNPAKSVSELKEFRRQSSLPLAFLQDCCEVYAPWLNPLTPDVQPMEEMASTPCIELRDAIETWAQAKRLEVRLMYFWRELHDLFEKATEARETVNGVTTRVVRGVRIVPDKYKLYAQPYKK